MKRLLAVLVVALTTASCGTTAKFVYPANPTDLVKITDMPKYNFRVAVLPFEEMRENKNQAATAWIGMIPGAPYGFVNYERPDAADNFFTVRKFEFDVSEDMAKAVVSSLKRSGLFKDVFFSFGGDRENADLIIQGEVNSTLYRGRQYTYCLSFFGPVLWSIGLPAGSSNNQLDFVMDLKDRRTGKLLWKYQSRNETSVTHGYYYNWGHDVQGYAQLMQDGMNNAVQKLDRAMAAYHKSGIPPEISAKQVREYGLPPIPGEQGLTLTPETQQRTVTPVTLEESKVTIVKLATVHNGPNSDYMVLGAIPVGARIEILEEKHGWYRFSSELFENGWINREYTDKAKERERPEVRIVRLARVYTGPSSDYLILGAIPVGATIKVLEEKQGWLRFSSELFEDGWINKKYTESVEARSP